jgi:type VI secretion system FHA domain protein
VTENKAVLLVLEVISPNPAKLGGASRQTFHEEGGSIGRETDNSWVLPHPKVSGHHARITHRHAVYYIEDTSRNGTYLVSSSKTRLTRGRPHALKPGDSILIDPYEIRVSITSDHRELETGRPFEIDDPFASRPVGPLELDPIAGENAAGTVDPLELLGVAPKPAPARRAPAVNEFEGNPLLDAHFQPPLAVVAPAGMGASSIPRDYDPLNDDSASIPIAFAGSSPDERPPQRSGEEERPVRLASPALPLSQAAESVAPIRARQPAPPTTDERFATDLGSVLAGAGLNPEDVTPELARSFGEILRVVVSGLIDVMQSRQQIKEEFGLRTTRVRRAENNPLKFSVDANDALHNLLVKRNPAYLAPVAAFEDAFADLRDHQLAMLAGLRVAFDAMLAEFDPDLLQEEFDRRIKGLVPTRKLRYWDLYREKGQEIVKDRDASFRRLFGEAFARAYDEQLNQLKAGRRQT